MSSTCSRNMVNFGPLTAEIVQPFWAPLQISTGFASWQRYCTASSSGRQLNFAALNRGHHLCSAGRPSRWALAAHILVNFFSSFSFFKLLFAVLVSFLKNNNAKSCQRFFHVTVTKVKTLEMKLAYFTKKNLNLRTLSSQYLTRCLHRRLPYHLYFLGAAHPSICSLVHSLAISIKKALGSFRGCLSFNFVCLSVSKVTQKVALEIHPLVRE